MSVYEHEKKVFASAILPTVAMSFVENGSLKDITQEIDTKLKRVIDNT